jgi:PAS domain S-box-containing protein
LLKKGFKRAFMKRFKSLHNKILALALLPFIFTMSVICFFSFKLVTSHIFHHQKIEMTKIVQQQAALMDSRFELYLRDFAALTKTHYYKKFVTDYKESPFIRYLSSHQEKFPVIWGVVDGEQYELFHKDHNHQEPRTTELNIDSLIQKAEKAEGQVVFSLSNDFPCLGEQVLELAIFKKKYFAEEVDSLLYGVVPLSLIIGDLIEESYGNTGFFSIYSVEQKRVWNSYLSSNGRGKIRAEDIGTKTLLNGIDASEPVYTRAILFGIDYMVASFPLKKANWSVILTLPYEEAVSSPTSLRNKILLTSFGAIILAAVVAILFSRTITAPLSILLGVTEKVANGDLDCHAEISTGDELEKLADSFNIMISNLAILMERDKEHAVEQAIVKSEKKNMLQLQQSEEKFRTLAQNIPGMIYRVKPDLTAIFLSGLEELTGYEEKDIYSKKITWQSLVHPDDRDRFYNFNTRFYYKPLAVTQEYRIITRSGDICWVLDFKTSTFDNNDIFSGIDGVVFDITDKKEMELMLFEAIKKAEQASEAKSAFLANMSHELRTPMNAILGMLYLALKTELTPKQHDYLVKSELSAKLLLGLINDILDFSKIEAGKLVIEEVDFQLDTVLTSVSNLISLQAQQKGLEIIFSISPEIPFSLKGDPLRLGQIIINLTNNAIKFTEQGEIIVSAELVQEKENQARLKFAIKDTGIGISKKHIDKLFQSFHQADRSTTRKYGGTGLGLAISKSLVEMMGGELSVDSVLGQGSTFKFSIIFGTQTKQKKKRLLLSQDIVGLRALIIDDNYTSQTVLKQMLISFNMEAMAVSSAEEGYLLLEKAEKDDAPFDLVLMDWRMPGVHGVEAIKTIKNNNNLRKKPAIIMVTAFGDEAICFNAKAAGGDGFVMKPILISTLFETIIQIFSIIPGGGVPKITNSFEHEEKLQGLRGARVLLVEDNKLNQQVASEILANAAMIVEIAENGIKAVEMARQNPYDIIFMDIQMPLMDGIKATSEIRKLGIKAIAETPVPKSIPIIAMTAHAMSGDRQKSLNAGMDDHITKPIDPDDLYQAMVNWVSPGNHLPADKSEQNQLEYGKQKGKSCDFPYHISGVDLNDGLRRVMGNEELFLRILRDFKRDNAIFYEQVNDALNNKNIEAAHTLVHTLKGTSGQIGAGNLQEMVLELESAIKDNSEEVNDLLVKIRDSLQDLFKELEKIPDSQEEIKKIESSEIVDLENSPQFADLKKMVEISDIRAEIKFFEIKKILDSMYPKQSSILTKALDSFDFKLAQQALDDMKK